MGIRTTGSLGSGSDIKQAYVIFEKNVVMPLRDMVSDIFNELLFIAKIDADFTINNYQIINEAIVELEGDTSKTNDALNTSSTCNRCQSTRDICLKNEIRALASLPPM
jgi:hypothetical protein